MWREIIVRPFSIPLALLKRHLQRPDKKIMEAVKIPNTKGQHIAAVVHYPETQTEKLAVLCPGYLDTKDYDSLVKLADALAERGYTAVRFDPTGTWESEGGISDYLTSQYIKDIGSVLEYMLKQGNFTHILRGEAVGRRENFKQLVIH